MKRLFSPLALTMAVASSALFLSGCSTTESRISEHPEIYNSLSPSDQQLVAQGQIRAGMPQSAVFLSWGSPDRQAAGNIKGTPVQTWIYTQSQTVGYGYGFGGGFGYPGYYGGFGGGFGGGFYRNYGGHRFRFYGDPFYDPFYSGFPVSIETAYKSATFARGRVMSFQYLVPPYR
ncbi:MAG: hypothetical protein M3R59_09555 [Verrucomicrobiota bacterium]|nr:hypothetical protein [Verrucomicrobiota bacterium]